MRAEAPDQDPEDTGTIVSRRCGVDTEAIASEIVAIRNRLEEIEQSEETEAEEERARLAERLGFLQSRLTAPGSEKADQDEPAEPDDVQYLPPA